MLEKMSLLGGLNNGGRCHTLIKRYLTSGSQCINYGVLINHGLKSQMLTFMFVCIIRIISRGVELVNRHGHCYDVNTTVDSSIGTVNGTSPNCH